ncbi:MAG: ATP-binding protein [Actinomycetota bacterium]
MRRCMGVIGRWSPRDLTVFLAVAGAGLALTAAATFAVSSREREDRTAELAGYGRLITGILDETIDQGTARTRSIRAFFAASEEVDAVEFDRFARNQSEFPGLVATGFARIVPHPDWGGFLEGAREERPQFQILGSDGRPLPGPTEGRPSVPVWYGWRSTTGTPLLGLDLGENPDRREAIERARQSNRPAMTRFLQGGDGSEGSRVDLYLPVNGDAGGGPGVAFASVDVLGGIRGDTEGVLGSVQIGITDVAGNGADARPIASATSWVDTVEVADRTWEVTLLRPEEGGPSPLFLTVLISGAAVAILAGGLVSMLIAARRRREELRKLMTVTRDKDGFLTSVAHELRAPLTSVVGITALLDQSWERLRPDEARDLLGVAHAEATDLADLIEDLLAAGRLEAGAIRYRPEPVEIGAEVRRCLARVDTAELDVDLPEPGLMAHADPLRVRQIIRNLVVNGIRYAHTRLAITGEQMDDSVRLEVRNDGPPIPPHLEEALFEPYQRGTGGTNLSGLIGLGLPVSYRLARAMGGELAYSYRDGWCTFTLHLPGPGVQAVSGTVESDPSPLVR